MNTEGNLNQAFLPTLHNISTNQTFNFQLSNINAFIHDKNKRKTRESSAISYYKTI